MTKRIILIIAALVAVYLLVTLVRIRLLSGRAGEYIANTTPFTQEGESGKKVLILGDSIAYGTGTSSPEKSVAGLVATNHYKDAEVTNLAKNGLRTNELAAQIKDIEGKYDLVFIIIGGNDILRPWISMGDSADNLKTIYGEAARLSDNVIALTTGNFKYTTFFLPPLTYYFGARSVDLRDSAVEAANQTGITYVNIVAYNERSEFKEDMEAEDNLHLSDAGAQYWYEEIKRVANLD